MGKSTISMAIFHCYVSSPEANTKNSATYGDGAQICVRRHWIPWPKLPKLQMRLSVARHVASWRRNLDGKKAGGVPLIQWKSNGNPMEIQWKSNYIEKFLFCWWGSVYLFQEVYCRLLQLTLFLLVCQWPFLIISSDIKLLVGGLEHEFIFHNILGMSSSQLTQLTNSIIFQRGRFRLNHQAVFIEGKSSNEQNHNFPCFYVAVG